MVADVSASISRELCRHCLRKPVWTKLLPPGKAWERAHGLLDPSAELPDDSFSYNDESALGSPGSSLDLPAAL